MERFAHMLDVTVVNLKDAGQTYELGNGVFYTALKKKLTESYLTRYRWIFETCITEWESRSTNGLAGKPR